MKNNVLLQTILSYFKDLGKLLKGCRDIFIISIVALVYHELSARFLVLNTVSDIALILCAVLLLFFVLRILLNKFKRRYNSFKK